MHTPISLEVECRVSNVIAVFGLGLGLQEDSVNSEGVWFWPQRGTQLILAMMH
jgi:hypothetical protein